MLNVREGLRRLLHIDLFDNVDDDKKSEGN